MSALDRLANAVGVARTWWDAKGVMQTVEDEALISILSALGHTADTEADRERSLAGIAAAGNEPPQFLSADTGHPIVLPDSLTGCTQAELLLEDGRSSTLAIEHGCLPALAELGYHRLYIAGHELTLAVAPTRCPSIPTAIGRRPWGPVVQIPSLREAPKAAYGNFDDLALIVPRLKALGADAVAISPVHALAPGTTSFSPYSPDSRLFLNVAFAGPAPRDVRQADLIDWHDALPRQFAQLRSAFAAAEHSEREAAATWAASRGEPLRRHALFCALSLHFGSVSGGWRGWPEAYRDPDGDAALRFAEAHGGEIEFHAWTQWRAWQGLTAADQASRESGMTIGLISDLAVGIDPGGSDAWAMQDSVLTGLVIGAPPDPLGPQGQNWGLTGFSPDGLRRSAFAPFVQTLRSALGPTGGVRIDHGFGLQRLWVIPEGKEASQGAYLACPFDDLLRIVALEAHRANAIVVAEDLGTRPPGYDEAVAAKGIAGMRVLWFERDHEGNFCHSGDYPTNTVAMTSTHDIATVAGWWRGRDLDWYRRLGRELPEAESERQRDRQLLWRAIGGGSDVPAADETLPVVEAAVSHVAAAGSVLALVPLEDMLGLEEQPNIPGTIDEHPNWRRRLSAPLDDQLVASAASRRVDALDKGRKS